MSFAVWDFIFSRSSFKPVLPMAFTCAVQASTGASRRANRGCLRLGWCCFPTPPPNRPRIVAQGRVLFSPQNELTPPPKGGGAGYHLGWVCWGFHAEKPGTFPQEKTDTSYPRALLMCDKEAIEVQKILPFLSDTWPLCRIGRAVIRASQSCRQSCNKSQCPACGCRSRHSCTHARRFSQSFPARGWVSIPQRQGACGQSP